MSLKKYLKSLRLKTKGQIFMEYATLLVVLAALTIAASSDFFKGFRSRVNRFQTTAVTSMGSANAMSSESETEPEPEPTPGPVVINTYGGW
jgi:uncharacterized protein (UPF0333 family)